MKTIQSTAKRIGEIPLLPGMVTIAAPSLIFLLFVIADAVWMPLL